MRLVTEIRLGGRRLVAGRRATGTWIRELSLKSHRLEQAFWEPAWAPAIESGPEEYMVSQERVGERAAVAK